MLRRRRFVAAAAAGASLLGGCASPRSPATPGAGSGNGDDPAWVARLTWGVDGATVATAARTSRAEFIRSQLHPDAAPALPSEVQARVDALPLNQRTLLDWAADMAQRRRDADALTGVESRRDAQRAYQQALTALARDAAAQCLFHALHSRQQMREQLAWFWFNHFNVHQYKGNLRVLVGDYQAQLRQHALGRFEDLLIGSATHPAMLRYLDNEQNAADRLNENFARELMELHTLGIDAGYSQRDVQELARVLTGLGVNFSERTPTLRPALQGLYTRRGAAEFNPARHDFGAKQLLGETVAGRGWEEIIGTLIRLARHPSTARHVSQRLAVHFCADAPDPAVVDRMSRAFVATGGRIDETLQAMFDAPQFAASLGSKFKDPVHYVVSAVRLASDGRTVQDTGPLQGWIRRLGEGLHDRQTPDGYPLDAAAWSASGQMSGRFEVARAIADGGGGLFAPAGAARPLPQLSTAVQRAGIAQRLEPPTQQALADATSASEWNTLLFSSPEFMFR